MSRWPRMLIQVPASGAQQIAGHICPAYPADLMMMTTSLSEASTSDDTSIGWRLCSEWRSDRWPLGGMVCVACLGCDWNRL